MSYCEFNFLSKVNYSSLVSSTDFYLKDHDKYFEESHFDQNDLMSLLGEPSN